MQRIQRFAQNNRFKRSVLQLIAEELLSRPGALHAASASLGSSENLLGSLDAGEEMDDSFGRRARKERVCPLGEGGEPIIPCPNSSRMHAIFDQLNFTGDAIDRKQAAEALADMGYRLEPSEVGGWWWWGTCLVASAVGVDGHVVMLALGGGDAGRSGASGKSGYGLLARRMQDEQLLRSLHC